MNNDNYLQFDYSRITEAGLKRITKAFEREGMEPAAVDATNVPKRVAGVATKTAAFIFDSGQRVELLFKGDGAVYQVKLNGRVVPVKNTTDLKAAVKELVILLQRGEASFKRAQDRRTNATVNRTAHAEVKLSVARRLKDAEAELEQHQQAKAANDATLAELAPSVEAKAANTAALDQAILALRERKASLIEELNSVEAA